MPASNLSKLDSIRHSLAHLLAMAVLKKFPKAKLGIGPVIENGFYYDFKLPKPLTDTDLPELEATMRELVRAKLDFKGEKITVQTAKKIFSEQPFKLELIKEFSKKKTALTLYRTGDFVDLCRGGHIRNTTEINAEAFKLEKIAGAYWRGDEKNPQLTRIYGLAFQSKAELDQYTAILEEARKRDHRVVGRELGLFVISDLVGSGLPLYTPKGALLLQQIKDYSRALRKEIGFQEVQTPNINKADLFKRSGHYEKFKENMLLVRSHYSEEEYFLKPMNCPQHTQLYAAEPRSYRDLPIKFADFALLYRDEKPGELSGLTRLRSFSQDDGHCFCRVDQIEEEFSKVLSVITKAMSHYGLSYHMRLSLRDPKHKAAYLGSDEVWRESEKILRNLLKKHGVNYVEAEGEAAFYGPKLDLIVKDSLGRAWQLSTIQLDFNMPGRFGLEYVDADGTKKTPVMIHSAIVGSPERFLGVLIEHFAGAFPLWLAPVQIAILTVTDEAQRYAADVLDRLVASGYRAELDDRKETIGKKIRESELQKIPYLLVIGKREAETKTVAVRERGKGDIGSMTQEKFMNLLNQKKNAE